jgi:hypothetical protein
MRAAFTVAAIAAGSLFATASIAQTMDPIPNPPETGTHAVHHAKVRHHHHNRHHVARHDTSKPGDKDAGASK